MKRVFLPLVPGVAVLFLLISCGGSSTSTTPLINPEVMQFQLALTDWMLKWREAGIPTLDRDLYRCYGPSDPQPPPAAPDPSGHSNAAVPCAQAARQIADNLQNYRALVDELGRLTSGSNNPLIESAHKAAIGLHQATLKIHEDAVAALNRNDLEAIAQLKHRYREVEEWNARLAQALSAR